MDWSQFRPSDQVEQGHTFPWIYRALGLDDYPTEVLRELRTAVRNPTTPYSQLFPDKYSRDPRWQNSEVSPLSVDAGLLGLTPADGTLTGDQQSYPPDQPRRQLRDIFFPNGLYGAGR